MTTFLVAVLRQQPLLLREGRRRTRRSDRIRHWLFLPCLLLLDALHWWPVATTRSDIVVFFFVETKSWRMSAVSLEFSIVAVSLALFFFFFFAVAAVAAALLIDIISRCFHALAFKHSQQQQQHSLLIW
jgi:hypothetical protein